MDNKVTKERIGNHLEYDWYKYILLVAAAITVVLVMFAQINKTRVEEKFSLFFSAYTYSPVDFYSEVKSASLKGYDADVYGEDILREAYFEFMSPIAEGYAEVLAARSYTADAMIVPKSYLYDEEENAIRAAMSFVSFTDKVLGDIGIGEGYEYLRFDDNGKKVDEGGTICAVRVDNLTKFSSLKVATFVNEDDKTQETEFYLVIGRNGANTGKINKEDKAENRQTFYCLKVFFDLYGI